MGFGLGDFVFQDGRWKNERYCILCNCHKPSHIAHSSAGLWVFTFTKLTLSFTTDDCTILILSVCFVIVFVPFSLTEVPLGHFFLHLHVSRYVL